MAVRAWHLELDTIVCRPKSLVQATDYTWTRANCPTRETREKANIRCSSSQAQKNTGVQIQPWGVSDTPTGVKIPPPALSAPPLCRNSWLICHRPHHFVGLNRNVVGQQGFERTLSGLRRPVRSLALCGIHVSNSQHYIRRNESADSTRNKTDDGYDA